MAYSSTSPDWRSWTPVVGASALSNPISIPVPGGQLIVPSVAAMCLNVAIRSYEEALRKRALLHAGASEESCDSLAYDYIENLMITLTFSVASLEAFANAVIQQSLGHSGKYKGDTADEIQENGYYSLARKLDEVLPCLTNKKQSPKKAKQALWTGFSAMKDLRNELVEHPKTQKREDVEFWIERFGLPDDYPGIAEKLMRWYIKDDLDCWLNRRPQS